MLKKICIGEILILYVPGAMNVFKLIDTESPIQRNEKGNQGKEKNNKAQDQKIIFFKKSICNFFMFCVE